jgi:hypothetical protein
LMVICWTSPEIRKASNRLVQGFDLSLVARDGSSGGTSGAQAPATMEPLLFFFRYEREKGGALEVDDDLKGPTQQNNFSTICQQLF